MSKAVTERCFECREDMPESTGHYFTLQNPKCHKDPRDPAARFDELFLCVDCKHAFAAEVGEDLDEYDRANSGVRVVKHGPNSAGPGGAMVDVSLYMRPADADDADRFATERRVWRIVYQPSGRRLLREYQGESGVAVHVVECRPARPMSAAMRAYVDECFAATERMSDDEYRTYLNA